MIKSAICALLLLLGWGCQSQPKNGGESSPKWVKINILDEPQTLDPRKVRSLQAMTIVRMLFEGLTRINLQDKAELALADSVHISSDLKTYTFSLKKSNWSNGDPLTASDFVYTWQKALSPEFPSDTAYQLYVIKNAKGVKEGQLEGSSLGAVALDPLTLQVELENPIPYFLDLLATPSFFPVNEKLDSVTTAWTQNAGTFVGNGPFALKEWNHQDKLTVEKNARFWDAENVFLHGLELCMMKEEVELKMFEKGELDWAGSPLSTLPIDALASLRSSDSFKTKQMLATNFMRINTERPPFNHPLLRKAFAYAIYRQAIVEHVTQGNQIPATGLVPPALGLQNSAFFNDGDVAEAKRLFEEGLSALNITRDQLPEISLMYRAGERNHLIAQTVQEQWFKAFGIWVKLESLEAKVLFERISKQNYYLCCGDWVADFADPINFLEVFKYKSKGSNNTCWENADYVDLLERSSCVADLQVRRQLLMQSEKILIDEMPIIPIFYFSMLYLNQPRLSDVALSSMGMIDFRWAKWDETGDNR